MAAVSVLRPLASVESSPQKLIQAIFSVIVALTSGSAPASRRGGLILDDLDQGLSRVSRNWVGNGLNDRDPRE